MKNLKTKTLILFMSLSVISLTSCKDDDNKPTTTPIENGSGVTIRNTFQGTQFTNGVEEKIEDLFMFPEGSLEATATVAEAVEFPAYLLGLYDIDIDENSINFTLVAQEGDETYGDLFRTIEAGSTDRYYMTFANSHNVKSFTSSDSAVNFRIDSDKILVVEIGEGFVFQPGGTFSISKVEFKPDYSCHYLCSATRPLNL